MTFVLYRSGFEFRWRLRAANGRIIADSGEGYFNKSDCLAAIRLVEATTAANPVADIS
jgi:uncharacterized protein